MKKIYLYILVALFCISCNETSDIKSKNNISVSIEPLRFFVEQIVGDDFQINVVVPAGTSPEIYEPTPLVIKKVSDSKMFVSIGLLDSETAVINAVKDNDSIRTVQLYGCVATIQGECSHKDNHEEHHHPIDPHIWSSIDEAKIIANEIYNEVIKISADSSDKYSKNLAVFLDKINELEKYANVKLSNTEVNTFMIYHPALAYLARKYNLAQKSIEEDGKEPTGASLKELVEFGKNNNIKKILYQSQFDANVVKSLANELNAEAVVINTLDYNWLESMYDTINKLHSAMNPSK